MIVKYATIVASHYLQLTGDTSSGKKLTPLCELVGEFRETLYKWISGFSWTGMYVIYKARFRKA